MKIYLAADHAGFGLKNVLTDFLRDELGHDVEDCGAHAMDSSDDYPDFVADAARKLSDDIARGLDNSRAIIFGASGQGEAIVANRFKGIRAVVFYGEGRQQTDASGQVLGMIASTRLHNDANVLSLGARFIDAEVAREAVREWLATPFSGEERHVRRVHRIDAVV